MARIPIGTVVKTAVTHPETSIGADTPALEHLAQTPWGKAALEKRLGTTIGPSQAAETTTVTILSEFLDRHSLLVGSSGGGKSRTCQHLIMEQIRAGVSVIALDPKFDTLVAYLAHCRALGLKPHQLTCIAPRVPAIPGWNPFATGVPVEQAVAAFVALLAKSSSAWGPRLEDLLTNACLVIAANGLSLYELTHFIVNDAYRAAILAEIPTTLDPVTFEAARDYFHGEFDQWTKLARSQATAPVTNKIRTYLRNPFLRALCCPKTTTLDLASLWRRQQVVLVHLDEPLLGADGVRLLGGMLANALFQTAMRTEGANKVLLVLDELASLEKFMGTAITDIVTVARSRGLRLMVACQHLSQLSDSLSAALLANCAVQVFFRVGAADSTMVGRSLAVTSDPWIKRIHVSQDGKAKAGEPPLLTSCPHRVLDSAGLPLGASPAAWAALKASPHLKRDPVKALYGLAAQCGKGRLYVRSADQGEAVELRQYCAGVHAAHLSLTGPSPLQLIVCYPPIKPLSVERMSETDLAREWARVLVSLPVQHCAIRLAGGRPQVVKVVNVPDAPASPDLDQFVQAVVTATSQTPEEIAEALRTRRLQVERLSGERSRYNIESEVPDESLF